MNTCATDHRRILIVDDNRAIHEDFRKILVGGSAAESGMDEAEALLFGGEGPAGTAELYYQIESAYQGQDALEMVRQALAENRPYSMAFVDVRMPPGWDGIETCQRLWEADPYLQVVICTAFSDYSWEEMVKELKQVEQFLILKKPFDIMEVRQMANSLTEKWQLGMQLRSRMHDLEVLVEERTEALRDSLSLCEATLESTADAMLVLDLEGRCVRHNRKLAELWGIEASDLVDEDTARPLRRLSRRLSDTEGLDAAIRAFQSDPEGVSAGHLLLKDGRIFAWDSQPHWLEDRVVGRVWSFRDVTQQVRAEEALRQSEQLWRAIVENEPEGIFMLDAEGRLQLANASGQKMLGMALAEVNGKRLGEFVSTSHRPAYDAMIGEVLEGRIEAVALELDGRDDSHCWLDAHAVPLRQRGENVDTILIVARDQTERVEMEDRLMQAQKMEAVGRLAGGIAHDFNNLLTVINGYAELLVNRMPKDDPNRYGASEILKAGERAACLTRQLLAFSRRQMHKPSIVNLGEHLRDIYSMLERILGEDIEKVCEIDPKLWNVKVDPGQMTQVVMNMAVNSRDAMPEGGKLALRLENQTLDARALGEGHEAQPGDYVVMEISDNGQGMDEKVQRRIFEPFFTSKAPDKGTGLGLAIVYGIIKQSEGWITVDSTPGKGTTFRIYLPRTGEDAETEEPRETFEALNENSEGTILLVEDEVQVRKLMRSLLLRQGYRVIEAHDGEDGLERFREHHEQVDMVITDVIMPNMNGVQMVERLREIDPGVRILYTSGYTDQEIVPQGLDDTKGRLVKKPFEPGYLIRRVQTILAQAKVG